MDDYMEMGSSGLIPIAEGWWLDKATGNKVSPEGKIYSPSGDFVGEINYQDNGNAQED